VPEFSNMAGPKGLPEECGLADLAFSSLSPAPILRPFSAFGLPQAKPASYRLW